MPERCKPHCLKNISQSMMERKPKKPMRLSCPLCGRRFAARAILMLETHASECTGVAEKPRKRRAKTTLDDDDASSTASSCADSEADATSESAESAARPQLVRARVQAKRKASPAASSPVLSSPHDDEDDDGLQSAAAAHIRKGSPAPSRPLSAVRTTQQANRMPRRSASPSSLSSSQATSSQASSSQSSSSQASPSQHDDSQDDAAAVRDATHVTVETPLCVASVHPSKPQRNAWIAEARRLMRLFLAQPVTKRAVV